MKRGRNKGRPSRPIDAGLGYNARNKWSGERQTPNPQQQLMGFHIGQVMDDQDDQRMGRVWVYIAGVSTRRFDDQSLPAYGGTTPDRESVGGLDYDQKLRQGWILVSPMSPFFGSDDYRNQAAPDGRNSSSGDVNSYGMWHQPRVGDFVGVMFAGGDANSGYWMGMVPKQYSNGMVPGIPGTEAQNVSSREQNELLPDVQTTARVPTMDRTQSDDDPEHTDVVMTSDLARAQIRAGVSGDMARGAGTSGARRESPSYVTGMKTGGWSYDSEKRNRNVDGSSFETQVDRYYDRNSVGHSFTMDDHPDHQSMRMRTSGGAQFLMQDACSTPYIYLQTQTGNAWIEIADSGDIMIYAGGGLHVHAEGDYNLTVDGDMNIGVGGNVHWRTGGDFATSVGGTGLHAYGDDVLIGVEGQYDFQAGDDARLTYNGDLDIRAAGGYNFTIGGGMDIISGGGIRQQAGGDLVFEVDGNTIFNTTGNQSQNVDGNINTTVGGATFFNAGGAINTTAGGSMLNNAGAGINFQGGGNFNVDASNVNLNSGTSSSAVDANPDAPELFFPASTAATPVLPPLNTTSRSPEQDEIIGNRQVEQVETVAKVVPQHQPWGQRCGHGATPGTNGLVSSSPVDGGIIPPSDNMTCNRMSNPENVRLGAGLSTSTVPDNVMGGLSSVVENIPVLGAALGYRTDSRGENPNYRSVRLASERETHTPDSLSLSEEGIRVIQGAETFIPRPILDPLRGGYVVGYGHRISFGDTIAGTFLDSDIFRNIADFSNDGEKALQITLDEAETYLERELEGIVGWARETFPDIEFTQQQFDTLISFTRNIGLETLQNDENGQRIIQGIQQGNFDVVQDTLPMFSYVGGAVDCNVLDRRRSEASRFGQHPDFNGLTGQAIGYVPQGETVSIAGFNIEAEVFNAICNAQNNIAPQLPAGYMLTICAQESAFNPTAQASTSSAAGLFQFIRDTGARYGLSRDRSPSSNVFDPVANANAGAQFNLDNYNTLVAVGIGSPNATDLYMAHFLGAGDRRARNGAARFLTQPANAIPANDPAFRAAARANRSIFYREGRTSSPRTYAEVYAVMERKIGRRLPAFQNACNSSPPINPPGDFQWIPGSRTPNFTGVDPRVRAIVERSAVEAGISELGFNSGFRSREHNASVGGAQNSQHIFGKAIDINIGILSTAQKRAFVDRLAANGITGMGVGTNTIHADIRNAGRVTWTYRGGNGFARDILQRYGYRGV